MILEKILLGISLAAPIGPVSIEMCERGLKYGFWAAFKVRLGAVLGNILCLILSYLGLACLTKHSHIVDFIGLAGSIYLIISSLKSLCLKTICLNYEITSKDNAYMTGFILSLVNPIAIIFWLSIFAIDSSMDNPAINLFIIVGVLIWGVLLSGMLQLVGRFILTEVSMLIITKSSGFILLILGLKYAWINCQKILF